MMISLLASKGKALKFNLLQPLHPSNMQPNVLSATLGSEADYSIIDTKDKSYQI